MLLGFWNTEGAAPWVHRAKTMENLKFDEEDEQQQDIVGLNEPRYKSNASHLNVDDDEKLSSMF